MGWGEEDCVKVNPNRSEDVFLKGEDPNDVRVLELDEFAMCSQCMEQLAKELLKCKRLERVEMKSLLGAPEGDILRFIRQVAGPQLTTHKIQFEVPCYFKPGFWRKVKEAYGLDSQSSCEEEELGLYEYERHAQWRKGPRYDRDEFEEDKEYEDHVREHNKRKALWDELEWKHKAESGLYQITPKMWKHVKELDEQALEKELEDEMWWDEYW
jgi:hypothetical protein